MTVCFFKANFLFHFPLASEKNTLCTLKHKQQRWDGLSDTNKSCPWGHYCLVIVSSSDPLTSHFLCRLASEGSESWLAVPGCAWLTAAGVTLASPVQPTYHSLLKTGFLSLIRYHSDTRLLFHGSVTFSIAFLTPFSSRNQVKVTAFCFRLILWAGRGVNKGA